MRSGIRPSRAAAGTVNLSAAMLPNMIIIGAQKCGTSALHYYLSFHPEISMSRPKELNFFIKERNWPAGQEWYEDHFEPGVTVTGEASPNYTAHPHFRGVPRRMHSLVPDAKLIYMVRDPVDRIVSQYVHNYTKRRPRSGLGGRGERVKRGKGLAETVLERGTTYIPRSSYYTQIQRFLEFYSESSILVLAQNDLRSEDERLPTLRRVFRFLGVDESFQHKKFSQLRHQTEMKQRKTQMGVLGEKLPQAVWTRLETRVKTVEPVERPQVSDKLRRELTARLKDDIDSFREFTGRDFADWSI